MRNAKKKAFQTSRQGGGRDRNTSPPHTTKRRTTTNLKTKNNQNCQKIKLYGRLTTKEFKKKHSSRPVGEVEVRSPGGEDSRQGSCWRTRTGKVVAGGADGPTFAHG